MVSNRCQIRMSQGFGCVRGAITRPIVITVIEGEYADDFLVLGPAPVAVLPNYQRQGIGTLLIQHGLEDCTQLGCKAVVVLGYPEYYSRFGFAPAKEKGLGCEYPVPDEMFMVLELENGALEQYVGTVKYRSEFDKLE